VAGFSIDVLAMADDADEHRPLSPVSNYAEDIQVRPRLGFGAASSNRFRDADI